MKKNQPVKKNKNKQSSKNKSIPKVNTNLNIINEDLEDMKQWADATREKEVVKEKKQGKEKTLEETKVIKKEAKKKDEAPKPKQASTKQPIKQKVIHPKTGVAQTAKKQEEAPAKEKVEKEAVFKGNYLFYTALAVAIIPCLIVLMVFIKSHGNSNEPVEGNRFKGELQPQIDKSQLESLQTEIQSDVIDSVQINLKSATLRVLIDAKDDAQLATMEAILSDAYDIIVQKFPVDQYFTNAEVDGNISKKYDLEIDVYNFIPENDEQKQNQIHVSRVKNSSAAEYVDQVLTTAKDKETSDLLLHPDTSTPPANEE